MILQPIPAFNDNYIWALHDSQHAVIVDPGDAVVVLNWLRHNNLQLDTILVTHHHGDHTGGINMLRDMTSARVVGPAKEPIPPPFDKVGEGDKFDVLGHNRVDVLDVPGHTMGHVAYFLSTLKAGPVVFCGDTLFSGGCGRLFEGTPAQMVQSLSRLGNLPDATKICCAHEYTVSNLRFAQVVDPHNMLLAKHLDHCRKLREQNQPTLPSSMVLERQINPFLRTTEPALRTSALAYDPTTPPTALGVFTTLRTWKNVFV